MALALRAVRSPTGPHRPILLSCRIVTRIGYGTFSPASHLGLFQRPPRGVGGERTLGGRGPLLFLQPLVAPPWTPLHAGLGPFPHGQSALMWAATPPSRRRRSLGSPGPSEDGEAGGNPTLVLYRRWKGEQADRATLTEERGNNALHCRPRLDRSELGSGARPPEVPVGTGPLFGTSAVIPGRDGMPRGRLLRWSGRGIFPAIPLDRGRSDWEYSQKNSCVFQIL